MSACIQGLPWFLGFPGGAGGGAALLHLAEFVPEFAETLTDPEEKLGAEIVRKSIVCPARLIANNAGFEGDVIIESLLGKPFEMGYNAVSIPQTFKTTWMFSKRYEKSFHLVRGKDISRQCRSFAVLHVTSE